MFKVRSNMYPKMRQQLKLLIDGRETRNKILRWKGFLNKTQQTFWHPHYLVYPKTHYRFFCLNNSEVKPHFPTTSAQALTAYCFKLTCQQWLVCFIQKQLYRGTDCRSQEELRCGIGMHWTKGKYLFQHDAQVWGQLFIFQANRGEHWCNYA